MIKKIKYTYIKTITNNNNNMNKKCEKLIDCLFSIKTNEQFEVFNTWVERLLKNKIITIDEYFLLRKLTAKHIEQRMEINNIILRLNFNIVENAVA
jgi:hypothetical protein